MSCQSGMLKRLRKLLKPHHSELKDEPPSEYSFPCKIGSKITVEEYNNFLKCKESSGYKYQRKSNGNVFVIDMCNPEHTYASLLLRDYFTIPNCGVFINPPIIAGTNALHFNPSLNGEHIAADVTVSPNLDHVQRPIVPYPGDKNGNPHAQIICEVANGQSIGQLILKCQTWLNQVYVRYVIGIKLHDLRTTRDNQGRYYRSNDSLVVPTRSS